jgi:hypothetical protein
VNVGLVGEVSPSALFTSTAGSRSPNAARAATAGSGPCVESVYIHQWVPWGDEECMTNRGVKARVADEPRAENIPVTRQTGAHMAGKSRDALIVHLHLTISAGLEDPDAHDGRWVDRPPVLSRESGAALVIAHEIGAADAL